jgi:folylpolyglutamate synthase/dihydropteroate synthase
VKPTHQSTGVWTAHTQQRVWLYIRLTQVCADWFVGLAKGKSTLIFNCTHERQGSFLFPPLIRTFKEHNLDLSLVCFTTNLPFAANSAGDLTNLNEVPDAGLSVQNALAATWTAICNEHGYVTKNLKVCANVEDAVKACTEEGGKCLVTGSLHLVGAALTVLGAECV